eukprot:6175111-Pleurochrysis_carterae.AAC.2
MSAARWLCPRAAPPRAPRGSAARAYARGARACASAAPPAAPEGLDHAEFMWSGGCAVEIGRRCNMSTGDSAGRIQTQRSKHNLPT